MSIGNLGPLLCDGPGDAPATIVLAHGAGAGMRHAFLEQVALGFAAAGFAVVRFEFPYRRDGKRVPDRMPVLQTTMRDVVGTVPRGPIVLAGKSMGGRVATMLADDLGAAAVVVFGYPFHPPKKPTQLRTEHLRELRTRTLILQGERDEFGTRDEVAGYELSPAIETHWLPDGDHSLAPRKQSGHSTAGNFAAAMQAAIHFLARALA